MVAAVFALYESAANNGSLVLILSRSHRQSAELFHTVARFYDSLGSRFKKRQTLQELELETGSRIVSLPCQADTIRGYSSVQVLMIDEAARVPDNLYRTVRPMLATSGGRRAALRRLRRQRRRKRPPPRHRRRRRAPGKRQAQSPRRRLPQPAPRSVALPLQRRPRRPPLGDAGRCP